MCYVGMSEILSMKVILNITLEMKNIVFIAVGQIYQQPQRNPADPSNIVYVDFQKTFDKVHHQRMTNKAGPG